MKRNEYCGNIEGIAFALAIIDAARDKSPTKEADNCLIGATQHLVEQIGTAWTEKTSLMRWFHLKRTQLEVTDAER